MSLSKRAQAHVSTPVPEFILRVLQSWEDSFSPSNPDGFINVAVAENLLSLPLVTERLNAAAKLLPTHLVYDYFHGSNHDRHVLASFLESFITHTPVSPDHLIVLSGAAAVINALASVICDPHDVVIVTGPGYSGLAMELGVHQHVNVAIASLDPTPHSPPSITVAALQNALEQQNQLGKNVRAVIIISPNNPTGEVLSADTIRDIVQWTRQNSLHAIFDEVYALSVFDPHKSFVSVASAIGGSLGDDVHIIWSASKDFCISGARLGVIYSQSSALLNALQSTLVFFTQSSRLALHHFCDMLSDHSWVSSYVTENANRLREAYTKCVDALEELQIPFYPSAAGFFVWVDMRRYMTEATVEQEKHIWAQLCDAKVLFVPSHQCFGSQHGFFRICFAAVSLEAQDAMWERLRPLLQERLASIEAE